VFGGSWGSTLALAYAQKYPQHVKALILRGVFTLRLSELLWAYREGGVSWLYPEAWEKFLEPIPIVERGHLMSAYHRRLNGTNEEEKLRCAIAWSVWETTTSQLIPDPQELAEVAQDTKFSLDFARIESHYWVHGGFLRHDSQLIDDAHKLAHIPGTIIQGRYDMVCPPKSAHDLSKAWPKSELIIVPDAGHSFKEPGITDQLVRACDKYREL